MKRSLLLWACGCLLASSSALATEWRVAKAEHAAPEEAPAPLRQRLGKTAFRVECDGAAFGELWLVRELQGREAPAPGLGVAFPRLELGARVGLLRLQRAWEDYRKQTVPPGLYVLRYALQPEDGNHMGVSLYRDFLLLVPASKDSRESDTLDAERLIELSRTATGTAHPAVLALFPAAEDTAEATIARNELDQPMLVVVLGPHKAGLVLEGHGEIEGY